MVKKLKSYRLKLKKKAKVRKSRDLLKTGLVAIFGTAIVVQAANVLRRI